VPVSFHGRWDMVKDTLREGPRVWVMAVLTCLSFLPFSALTACLPDSGWIS
jgi:hypothetical protein